MLYLYVTSLRFVSLVPNIKYRTLSSIIYSKGHLINIFVIFMIFLSVLLDQEVNFLL